MSFYGFKKYVSVAEKREKALAKLEKLRKKDKNLQPVIISGRKIANSWWGIEWNKNLESYRDYAYRLERGRSYVRNFAVLDLKIDQGSVKSKVVGEGSRAYNINIEINELEKDIWKKLKKECMGKIASLQKLIEGDFPKDMKTLFTDKGEGLFPSPLDINFHCTCPDYAKMCKHVAAAMYGIGARLDNDPKLFFTLRGINIEEIIEKEIEKKSSELLKKSHKKNSRIIRDDDVNELFGLELFEE
jgi:uncharacterized Zn finger protein